MFSCTGLTHPSRQTVSGGIQKNTMENSGAVHGLLYSLCYASRSTMLEKLCLCVCVCVMVLCSCGCMCIWRVKDKLECGPLGAVHFAFEGRLSQNLELTALVETCCPADSSNHLVSASPALGLQAHHHTRTFFFFFFLYMSFRD